MYKHEIMKLYKKEFKLHHGVMLGSGTSKEAFTPIINSCNDYSEGEWLNHLFHSKNIDRLGYVDKITNGLNVLLILV